MHLPSSTVAVATVAVAAAAVAAAVAVAALRSAACLAAWFTPLWLIRVAFVSVILLVVGAEYELITALLARQSLILVHKVTSFLS